MLDCASPPGDSVAPQDILVAPFAAGGRRQQRGGRVAPDGSVRLPLHHVRVLWSALLLLKLPGMRRVPPASPEKLAERHRGAVCVCISFIRASWNLNERERLIDTGYFQTNGGIRQ